MLVKVKVMEDRQSEGAVLIGGGGRRLERGRNNFFLKEIYTAQNNTLKVIVSLRHY